MDGTGEYRRQVISLEQMRVTQSSPSVDGAEIIHHSWMAIIAWRALFAVYPAPKGAPLTGKGLTAQRGRARRGLSCQECQKGLLLPQD
jgi:hypothetical protein